MWEYLESRSTGYALTRPQLIRQLGEYDTITVLTLNKKNMPRKNTAVVSIGIDVGKATLAVALLAADKTHTSHSFSNTVSGIASLISLLKKHSVTEATPCVVEATGDYHLLVAVTVTRAGYLVNCINPIITKRYQKSSIRDAKTDTVDAKRLAEIGLLESDLKPFKADLKALGAKKALSLLAALERVKQQLAGMLNRFQETKELLGLSVECSFSDDLLQTIDAQIAELKKQIQKQAPPSAKQLAEKMSGVSENLIAILMSGLSGASFSNRDQLVAFVGLDVRARQSGSWQGKEHLSKRGNPYLRKILYQIAWGLKQNNPRYQQYYHRLYREEEKHYNTAMMAVARKFLRFFYAYHFKQSIPLSTVE